MVDLTFRVLKKSKLASLRQLNVLPVKNMMLGSVTSVVMLDSMELALFVGQILLKNGLFVEWVLQ